MRLPRVMVAPRRRRRAGVTTRVDTFCAGTRRAGSPRGVVPVAPVATEQDSWNLALPRWATRAFSEGSGAEQLALDGCISPLGPSKFKL